MESTINENYNEDIFHFLTGKYSKNKKGNYKFFLKDDKKKNTILYESQAVPIADPALDSNFKSIFINKNERMKNFLNNIYFIPNEMEINELNFIPSDYNKIGNKFNLNSLKPDIVCQAKLKNNKTILIDIEIQISWKITLDDRFINYGICIRKSNSDFEVEKKKELYYKKKKKEDDNISYNFLHKIEKKYKDVYVIALIIDKNLNNQHEKISFYKNINNLIFNELSKVNIIKINVNNIFEKINNNEKIFLFSKEIKKDGLDWFKFLVIRYWADKIGAGFIGKYLFPKCEIYSKNFYLNECIQELILENGKETDYDQLEEEIREEMLKKKEEGREEGREEGEKKTLLIVAYNLLKNVQNISLQYIITNKYIYNKEEIDKIFREQNIEIDNNAYKKLLEYLKKNKYLN